MNIANCITLSRILVGPLFVLLYIEGQALSYHPIVIPALLLILLTLAIISDSLDGYLARKYNIVTNLGKLIDPMTDSLMTISVLLTFTLEPIRLPMPLVFVFIYRDILMSTLRTLCALNGKALAASTTGKIKTIMQYLACYILLFGYLLYQIEEVSLSLLQNVGKIAVFLAACFSVYSGIEYLSKNWDLIKSEIK